MTSDLWAFVVLTHCTHLFFHTREKKTGRREMGARLSPEMTTWYALR